MNIFLPRTAAAVMLFPVLFLGCPVSAAPGPSGKLPEEMAAAPLPVAAPVQAAVEMAELGAAAEKVPGTFSAQPAPEPPSAQPAPEPPSAQPVPEPPPAQPTPEPPAPVIGWDLLWTGSWEKGGKLSSRADMKLSFTRLGIVLRGELLDRRPGDIESLWVLPWKNEEAETAVLGGLYHPATGSRIVYGPLEDWGLSARLRSPWSRGLPFVESRKASMADLRTSPSTKEPELYLYLGSPSLRFSQARLQPELRGFVALRMNPATVRQGDKPELTAGLEGRLGEVVLNLEGFYTGGELPAEKSSAWFSMTPPLPARSFGLYGLGLLFSIPYLRLSADWAWSGTFVYGRDLYTSLGISIGNKTEPAKKRSNPRWLLSLAADGAGPRYTGSDGGNPGAGFRAGGKFELQQERAGTFRVSTSLSGPGIGKNFNRSSSDLSYRPPASRFPLRLSRVSLSADRDARDAGHVKDSAGFSLGLAANPVEIAHRIARPFQDGQNAAKKAALTLGLSGVLTGSPATSPSGGIPPWPIPQGPYRFESAKAGAQLGWSSPLDLGSLLPQGTLELKAGLDYTLNATLDDGEISLTKGGDLSLSAALRGKRSRLGLKLTFPGLFLGTGDAPPKEDWKATLSWKVLW
jgi:hypothetical protein